MLGSWREHNTQQEQIKNKRRDNSQRKEKASNGQRMPCLKKLHGDGCFDCDEVITVRRFSPF
jgi:hypothetical protein